MHSSPRGRRRPQRDVDEDVETDEESQLQLDRDERGELEQAWAADDLAEEDVAGSGQR